MKNIFTITLTAIAMTAAVSVRADHCGSNSGWSDDFEQVIVLNTTTNVSTTGAVTVKSLPNTKLADLQLLEAKDKKGGVVDCFVCKKQNAPGQPGAGATGNLCAQQHQVGQR